MSKILRQTAFLIFIGSYGLWPLYGQEEYLEVDLVSDEDLQKLIPIKNFSCPESPGGSCYGIDLVNEIILFKLLEFKPADVAHPADTDDSIFEKLLSVNPFSKERELEFFKKVKPIFSLNALRSWNKKHFPEGKLRDRIETGLDTIVEKQMAKAIADSYKVPQKPVTIYGFADTQDFMAAMVARKEDPTCPLKRAVAHMTSHQMSGAKEFYHTFKENGADSAEAKIGDARGQAASILKMLGEGIPLRLAYNAFIGGHALTAVGYRIGFSPDGGQSIQIKILDSNRPQQLSWLLLKRANVDEPGFGKVWKFGEKFSQQIVAENILGSEGKQYEKATEGKPMKEQNHYQAVVPEIKAGSYYWIYEPWVGAQPPNQPMLAKEAAELEDRPSWLRGVVSIKIPGDDMRQAARKSLRPRIKLPDSMVQLKMEESIKNISKSVENISNSSASDARCISK